MKTLLFAFTGVLMLTASCTKRGCEDSDRSMTIIRDCTGTYLRADGKDYNVCNLDAVAAYPDGAKVSASFKRTTTCSEASDRIVCYMLHENEGWIQVLSIR